MNRVLSLLVALLGLVLPAAPGLAQITGTAARVNGVDITVFRLERHFDDYLKAQGRNVGMIRNPAVYKRLKREALEQLIDVELLWQEAQRRQVAVSEAEVDAAVARAEAGFRTREAFLARIADAGFDPAAYRAYVRRDLAARKVYASLGEGAAPSEADVRALADADPATRLRATQEAREGARRRALDALRAAATIERLLPLQ